MLTARAGERSAHGNIGYVNLVFRLSQAPCLIIIIDFFELQGRDLGPKIKCEKCPAGTKVIKLIKLIKPPTVIGDDVHHFPGAPLEIEVEECFTLCDLLRTLGVQTYSTALVSNSKEVQENTFKILAADILEKLKVAVGNSCQSLVCMMKKINPSYRIKAESLPSLENLIEWRSEGIYEKAKAFPTDVECVLDTLLVQFLKHKSTSKLVRYPHFCRFVLIC